MVIVVSILSSAVSLLMFSLIIQVRRFDVFENRIQHFGSVVVTVFERLLRCANQVLRWFHHFHHVVMKLGNDVCSVLEIIDCRCFLLLPSAVPH